jgi:hypothetical protein
MVLAAGGITTFNIQHGYVEALVRGYRSGYLDDVDYHHLTQCETLEGERAETASRSDRSPSRAAPALPPAYLPLWACARQM